MRSASLLHHCTQTHGGPSVSRGLSGGYQGRGCRGLQSAAKADRGQRGLRERQEEQVEGETRGIGYSGDFVTSVPVVSKWTDSSYA